MGGEAWEGRRGRGGVGGEAWRGRGGMEWEATPRPCTYHLAEGVCPEAVDRGLC